MLTTNEYRPQISISSFTPSTVLTQNGLVSMGNIAATSGGAFLVSPSPMKNLGVPNKGSDFLRVPPRPNPLLKSAAKNISESGWRRDNSLTTNSTGSRL
jgi:hypothetical protein